MNDRYIHVEIEDDVVLIDLDKETAIALKNLLFQKGLDSIRPLDERLYHLHNELEFVINPVPSEFPSQPSLD